MDRRHFLKHMVAGGVILPSIAPLYAYGAGPSKPLKLAGLRGALDASQFGVRPDAFDDQSTFLQKVLDKASKENKPVFLPPGTYVVSNINLPPRTRLMGISGTSRLIYSGKGAMFSGTGCELIELNGITLDGANRNFGEEFGGLIYARACPRVLIDNCDFIGSLGAGISLDTCGGRVERVHISGAAGIAGLFAVNSTGLSIQNNTVENCANGGILVHRWTVGDDNTIITGNRIQRIAAKGGGTGQRGNGINLFRANGVIVSNNHISNCAFSAVRANGASNCQITGNTCLGSGETAIYSEFIFEGSLIANNIVDGGTMGISIANFNEGGRLAVCANNLIRNLKTQGPYPAEVAGFGIGISVEADTSVTGNVIEGAPLYGINLGWGPYLRNVIAANNIIKQAGEGIIVSVVKGAGSATISGNIISGAVRGGIIGHEWSNAVTGELAGGKRSPFPHLNVHGNLVR
ncbi:MAG: TIGR03808 family TAT-translocated repetitive protein [Rhizobiaceae bacterium]